MAEGSESGPGLAGLASLIGDWDMEIWAASFLPNPDDRVRAGVMHIEWTEGGALLAMRQVGDPGTPPAARWLVGRDDAEDDYHVLYSDARGVSRIYRMSFDGSEWKLWRDNADFTQRFEGALSADRDRIDARWENCTKGGDWEHDFNVTYTRR